MSILRSFPAQIDEINPCNHETNTDPLMHGETHKNLGRETHKLDKKAGNSHQNEIKAKNSTGSETIAQSQQNPENTNHLNHLVNRRRMHKIERGHKTVGISHSPGQIRGNTIASIARKLTSPSPKKVPHHKSRRNSIQGGPIERVIAAKPEEYCRCSTQKTPIPGPTHRGKNRTKRIGDKSVGILENVKKFYCPQYRRSRRQTQCGLTAWGQDRDAGTRV